MSVVTTDSDFTIPKTTSVKFLRWGLETDGETNLKNSLSENSKKTLLFSYFFSTI